MKTNHARSFGTWAVILWSEILYQIPQSHHLILLQPFVQEHIQEIQEQHPPVWNPLPDTTTISSFSTASAIYSGIHPGDTRAASSPWTLFSFALALLNSMWSAKSQAQLCSWCLHFRSFSTFLSFSFWFFIFFKYTLRVSVFLFYKCFLFVQIRSFLHLVRYLLYYHYTFGLKLKIHPADVQSWTFLTSLHLAIRLENSFEDSTTFVFLCFILF